MTYLFHHDPPKVADSGSEVAIQTRLRGRIRMLSGNQIRLVAVPNGMKTTAWSAMNAKREGMSAGFVDLIAIARPKLVAFLEIKAHDGALSPDQINWLNWLHSAGFSVGCFRSVETAIKFLRERDFPFIDQQSAVAA